VIRSIFITWLSVILFVEFQDAHTIKNEKLGGIYEFEYKRI
jgi:hypothetical protein